jgi:hypothetical protein
MGKGDIYEVEVTFEFPLTTKLDSQFIAMLNDKTMNGFEDGQKMVEETSRTAISGEESKQ